MQLIRASSVSDLMSDAKSKKTEDLSAGALTKCYDLAKQFIYEYSPELYGKEIQKGIEVEGDSIAIFNAVFFCNAVKNSERKNDQYFTGEPDFLLSDRGVDIKSSWSFPSFPATTERAKAAAIKAGYDWQARVYMRLFDLPRWDIAYCLANTPEHLCKYENPELHNFDRLPNDLRITLVRFDRDKELEDLMVVKAKAAQQAIEAFIEEITNDHKDLLL